MVHLFLGPFPSFRTFAAGPLGSRRFAFLHQAREPLLRTRASIAGGKGHELDAH